MSGGDSVTLLEAAKKMLACVGDGFFVYDPDDSIPHCPECDSIGFEMYSTKKVPHQDRCEFGQAIAALREAVEREQGASVPGA